MRIGLAVATAVALMVPAGLFRVPAARGQGGAVKAGQREVEARTAEAMASFDLLEFEAAKRQLTEAIALARKNRLERDRVTARVYLDLGIVEFAGLKNREGARQAFAAAVAIDPTVEIGIAYRTEAMADLLAAVKRERAATAGPAPPAPVGERACAQLAGLEHARVEGARRGQTQPISARLGNGVRADQVSLFYRAPGGGRFTEQRMQRTIGCVYEAAIPAEVMQGEAIQYYVAALRGRKIVASRGSHDAPNVIALAEAPAVPPPGGGEVRGGAAPDGKKTLFLAVAAGTGGGYVHGATEVVGSDVDCCFAPAFLHFLPEIGFYLSPRMSLSAAFRLGFALGANVPGHASVAPAGVARLRYALSPAGTGPHVSAIAGGGIIRHTVTVEQGMAGADTDTTASGPFLLGGGIGYLVALSGPVQLVAELNALAAFPAGVEEIGPCPGSGCVRPQTSVQADLNIGVLFAF
jgi:hypothetical protein